ncbi:MAG: hypothetical protein JJU32_02325 [Phormidium sp. BM_Day4_Bin.17]|nr:hypothetical protein [Phormidium sp. BM_Day4_Bin.17]UCJ10945.1 MAG: hypothetical protein JWS08_14105 [Phormidium sp. PBR-2020]
MSAKLLEGAVGKVANSWLPNILGSPLLFWLGVFIAWVYSLDDNWREFVGWFSGLPDTSQFIAITLAVSLMITSDFMVQQLERPILRFLEGYWPGWSLPVWRWCIKRINQQQIALKQELIKRLTENPKDSETHDASRRIALEQKIAQLPTNFENDRINRYLMPTRLGNRLRAYERKSYEKYGLDAVICWPRLWLLLPDSVKLDLTAARNDLDAATRLWIWGVLFIACTGLNGLALPIGLLVAALAYDGWMLPAAEIYGILIEATFDTQRHQLYEALGLPRPPSRDDEYAYGQQLTNYLRGDKFDEIQCDRNSPPTS